MLLGDFKRFVSALPVVSVKLRVEDQAKEDEPFTVKLFNGAVPTWAEMPYSTYMKISDAVEHHQTGPSGLSVATLQLDHWAHTDDEVVEVGEDCRKGLQGFIGVMGATIVRFIEMLQEQDSPIPPADGSEQPISHRRQDFQISYFRSVGNPNPFL